MILCVSTPMFKLKYVVWVILNVEGYINSSVMSWAHMRISPESLEYEVPEVSGMAGL